MTKKEYASTLIEALPYIKKFSGKTIVIKYGGSAQSDTELNKLFAEDVVLLKFIGINVVIVHGGGPQIAETLEKIGKKSEFIEGLRVTDEETLDIVEMVLSGSTNKSIVRLINQQGGKAVGLSGSDAGLTKAMKITITKESNGKKQDIDIGRVGKVNKVNPQIIHYLTEGGYIPVIAPLGVDDYGNVYNINADEAAGAIAASLEAEKFILLTDVQGILDKNGTLIGSINKEEVQRLQEAKVIDGGMIPKTRACLEALSGGVKKTHIIDGRIAHALLLEVFTDQGVGTEIVN